MRTKLEVQNEIRKLRIIINSKNYGDTPKDAAWAMLLALQWSLTSKKTLTLSPMELSGLTMEQCNAVKKLAKRKDKLTPFNIRDAVGPRP